VNKWSQISHDLRTRCTFETFPWRLLRKETAILLIFFFFWPAKPVDKKKHEFSTRRQAIEILICTAAKPLQSAVSENWCEFFFSEPVHWVQPSASRAWRHYIAQLIWNAYPVTKISSITIRCTKLALRSVATRAICSRNGAHTEIFRNFP
jgi:hypothetical protein